MSKILFVYPNGEGYPIIPLGPAMLIGVLKHGGHNVELFDITFMVQKRLDHDAREKTGTVKPVDYTKYWGTPIQVDIYQELRNKIKDFKPDLVAFSIVESNYSIAKKCFEVVKSETSVPIIVGGVFPTIAPKFFYDDKNVDIICIGEGEQCLLELANKLDKKESYSNILNLHVKTNNGIIKNNYNNYYNWNPFIPQNWDLFDKRHLWKAYNGKMWKCGCFELSRGCPYNCSYCNNHVFQKTFKDIGAYHREKDLDNAINEMVVLKNKYDLGMIMFNDETFLMMNKKRIQKFAHNYITKVNLPFFIQTKAETMTEDNIQLLSNMNCMGIGIGIETGNETIRRDLLNKNTKNEIYEKAIALTNKYNIRSTGYVMIGLPFETKENILETAEFCKKLNVSSVAISIFAPFYGTKLYDVCLENGFIDDTLNNNISVNYKSILKQPQLSNDELEELYYGFNDLVFKTKGNNHV